MVDFTYILEIIYSNAPGLMILLPTATAFLIPLLRVAGLGRGSWEILSTIVAGFVCVLSWKTMLTVMRTGNYIVYCFGAWPPPIGIVYEIDMYASVMACLISSVMLLIIVYSIGYMRDDDRLYLYYTLLMGIEAGLLGCIFTSDFFHLFVMLEVASIAAYILVAYERESRIAIEASMKYAIFGALATTIYFMAVVFAYGSLGTLNLADMAVKIRGGSFYVSGMAFGAVNYGIALFTLMMLWAFTFKAALFPNHFWLPDAHAAAPTPVSALLSGLVVKVGVYVLARFTYTIFGGLWVGAILSRTMLVIGFITAAIGAVLMIAQRDLKKFIASSTVLNMGYIAVGYGLGTTLGLIAATYHIINHAVAKALMFMSAGHIIEAGGSRDIYKLTGVGRLVSASSIPFIISTLSLSGIPPFNIFMSKLLLYTALVESGYIIPAAILLTISVLAFIAYMRVMYNICIKPPSGGVRFRASGGELTVLAILSAACILLGVFVNNIVSLCIGPCVDDLVDTRAYIEASLTQIRLIAR